MNNFKVLDSTSIQGILCQRLAPFMTGMTCSLDITCRKALSNKSAHAQVKPENGPDFENVWKNRESRLLETPGFIRFALLRGDEEGGCLSFGKEQCHPRCLHRMLKALLSALHHVLCPAAGSRIIFSACMIGAGVAM